MPVRPLGRSRTGAFEGRKSLANYPVQHIILEWIIGLTLINTTQSMPITGKKSSKVKISALQTPYPLVNSSPRSAAQFNSILSIIPPASEPL